ncbi:MAG: gamma-glutamyl-gamma-aminobutyrate hydrolase family protein [Rhodospirillaceae bacterium]|nr:gamma-glutamyl-gamma-aminobutyrate hydrolase family protein [Rhodospirillaceae bacterium]
MMHLPLVGISTSVKSIDDRDTHFADDKYVHCISHGAGCLPMLLPALGNWYDMDDLVSRLDGLLLTGGLANIEPTRYGLPMEERHGPFDPRRDDTVMPLLRAALAKGVPFFGICRGIQELNVALGGTLRPAIHEVPGHLDHRAPTGDAPTRHAHRHKVTVIEGGRLHRITGQTEFMVNSLHRQGIDRPASRLGVEAMAPDGQIEAVHVLDSPAFALAVQWHPEWRFWEDPPSAALFKAFGDACRERAARRAASAAA